MVTQADDLQLKIYGFSYIVLKMPLGVAATVMMSVEINQSRSRLLTEPVKRFGKVTLQSYENKQGGHNEDKCSGGEA